MLQHASSIATYFNVGMNRSYGRSMSEHIEACDANKPNDTCEKIKNNFNIFFMMRLLNPI